MQRFQFLLLIYRLESSIFFTEVAPDVSYLRLGVVVFETHSYNTQSHFTFTALDKNFL